MNGNQNKKPSWRNTPAARILSVVLGASMALSLMPTEGLAWVRAKASDLVVEELAAAKKDDSIPEWAIDDDPEAAEPSLTTQASFPVSYDLRNDGWMTPVKMQNPWPTCWSFGAIAAAESSLLSSSGTTYAETVQAGTPFDLSERHLIYFAQSPITEADDPTQVGEGLHALDEDGNPNAPFKGGDPFNASTLFASAAGPAPEALFPYRGSSESTEYQYYRDHKDEVIEDEVKPYFQDIMGMTVAEYIQKILDDEGRTITEQDAYEDAYQLQLESSKEVDYYQDRDDWSVPNPGQSGKSSRFGSVGYVLQNGNVLPDYWVGGVRNEAGMDAIKQELLNGRGVAICVKTDEALPGETGKSHYLDRDTWAHYCFDTAEQATHAVCIVGWDDNYSRDNFKALDALGGEHKPEYDGAWLAKNSWGSETDASEDDLGNVVNRRKWGVKNAAGEHTGYFWISYEDVTLSRAETYEFSIDINWAKDYDCLQYDYMPVQRTFIPWGSDDGSVLSSANVFEVTSDSEIEAVSAFSPSADMRITFALYLLNDGGQISADGSEIDGELLYRTSKNYAYKGYHRLDLTVPITVRAGQRVAVVTTSSEVQTDGSRRYAASWASGFSKEYMEAVGGEMYTKGVINEGESFIYENGKWEDFSVRQDTIKQELEAAYRVGGWEFDNFGIKLYTTSADHFHDFTYSALGDTITATCGGAGACDVTEGLTLTIAAPADLTYDGRAKSASVVGGYSTTAFPGGYEIRYYRDDEEVDASDVVGAGDYVATLTACGATARVGFAIKPAKPARPATTAYPSKGRVAVSWKAVKGAESYQVQWRRAGAKKWTTKSTRGRSKAATGLKAGALYEFRVRAVVGSAKGAWSKPSRRWLRGAAGVQASAGKSEGSIRATWKADKAATGGYKVLVYAKKGGRAVATKKAKAGATSATVKGLKSGKSYYVRVRPYRVKSDTTYAGATSSWKVAKAR